MRRTLSALLLPPQPAAFVKPASFVKDNYRNTALKLQTFCDEFAIGQRARHLVRLRRHLIVRASWHFQVPILASKQARFIKS